MSSTPAIVVPHAVVMMGGAHVQGSPADTEEVGRVPMDLLDDPQEWPAFSRPLADRPDCWESHLVIEGMHCAACALNVEDALRGVAGVVSADVSAGSRRARLVWSACDVKPSVWLQAVTAAGYRAVPANDAFVSVQRRKETRQALWRWLVAGLCMMQVMMYAWPAYVAEPGDLSTEMEQLLRWASWVLSLPVLLFSCTPFFSAAWRDLRQRRISMDLPVALGIVITFGVSTVGTFDPQGRFGQEVYFDSLTMFVFFLLTGRWLELRLRDRTAGALDALMNRLPDGVLRQQADGRFARVTVRQIRVGDVLKVLPGEAFAADGRILEGRTQVDESLLTGESRPLARGVGDDVIAGSYNLASGVQMRVARVGAQTRFAQIVALMESAASSKPQLARLVDRMARPFLLGVLVAAAGAAAFWWPHDPGHALMVAVAVLVVTCPCALSLATPAAMLAAAGRMARAGVLVRRLQALETLAHVDMVVFDKTGTLTRDALELRALSVRPGMTPDQALSLAALLAQHSLHPISRALVRASAARGAERVEGHLAAGHIAEKAGRGVQGVVRAVDSGRDMLLRLGSAAFCGVRPEQGAPAPLTAEGSGAGEAGPDTHLSDETGWLATFSFHEGVRDEAPEVVRQLKALGLAVHLWSGDASQATGLVARAVGIAEFQGGCSPQDKLARMQAAQQQGRRVVMVGDGLNDGPVLAGADVAFVVGSLPLAQAQGDFVVMGSRLARIPQTVVLARQTLRIVRQNLLWAAIYNAVCVPLAVMGWLPAWLAGLGMAGSSLLVVLNALRLAPRALVEKEP